MRWILVLTSIASIVAAASYSMDKPGHPLAYANRVSHTFAAGDNGDASGWQECLEVGREGNELGVICEGTRAIQVREEFLDVVSYFCEFQFRLRQGGGYWVNYGLCQ